MDFRDDGSHPSSSGGQIIPTPPPFPTGDIFEASTTDPRVPQRPLPPVPNVGHSITVVVSATTVLPHSSSAAILLPVVVNGKTSVLIFVLLKTLITGVSLVQLGVINLRKPISSTRLQEKQETYHMPWYSQRRIFSGSYTVRY